MTTPRQNPHLDPAGSSVVSGEASGIETHTEVSRELSCPTKMSIDALLQQNDHPHPVRTFIISLSPKVKRVRGSQDFEFAGLGVTTRADTLVQERIIRRVHSTVQVVVGKAQVAMTTTRDGSQLVNKYTSAYMKRRIDPSHAEALGGTRTEMIQHLVRLLNEQASKLETTQGDLRTAPDGSVSGLASTYKLRFEADESATDDENLSNLSSPTSATLN